MIKIKVDGKEIEVPDHYTLLQAAEEAGAEVPRFCFHERLSVAGNCRMCLVEVKGGPPKPQASCAMGVKDLRPGPNGEPAEIFTDTPMVKKAREGVLEFLLINHPLDCPICDQGGECDLQDQVFLYGHNCSRYKEDKRAVEDKYFGPLIKTEMNRCIACTRCVRFSTEVAGVTDLGLIGRGENAEITTYLEKVIHSELQGNLIDLCPVGALTSRPYAFRGRPWELQKTESIDVMDALGCAIRVDTRGREVMRILPRINEEINEEWISDKTRFIFDGLKTQRLDRPYVRDVNNKLREASFDEAFSAIKNAISKTATPRIGAIAGDLASVEEMFALKELVKSLGSNSIDCRQDGTILDPKYGRASYLFNSTVRSIEDADAILMIGAYPRLEAAVLNARIRKRYNRGGVSIATIGESIDLGYPVEHLGCDIDVLVDLLEKRHPFSQILAQAQRPLLIIGQSALVGEKAKNILAICAKLAKDCGALRADWNGFSVLHTAASRVGGLDIGFVPPEEENVQTILSQSDILFLLGADELDFTEKRGFLVYIGSHGDKGAHHADVILPGAAYTEKSGLYVNMEGRVQMCNKACFAPGDAREDWSIIRALSEYLDVKLPYDSLQALRKRLFGLHPHLQKLDCIEKAMHEDIESLAKQSYKKESYRFLPMIKDFYFTNPIARASATMAECSAARLNNLANEMR